MAMLMKGTESTQALVDKFGYDTKQASHAWRVLDAVERFADTDFTDFAYAIKYEPSDARNNILVIKQGGLSLAEFKHNVARKLERTKLLTDRYNVPVDEETVEEVNSIVKDLVHRNIQGV
jgi:hypothetical protein